jgi:uncharacterized protein VirK/YbjX
MSKYKVSLISISNELNGSFSKRVKFILRGLFYQKQIKDLYELFQIPQLNPIIQLQPDIYNKPFREYLQCNYETNKKFESIQSHYNYISNSIQQNHIKTLYSLPGYNLLNFNLENVGNIDVNLCYIPDLGKEGEITLLLSLDNKDLYSIQFSFDNTNDLRVIIGGIQSRSIVENEQIKQVTKKMFGLRPRNFLIFIIRQICSVFNVKELLAIKTNYHIANCSHVSKTDKFQANYDQYWEEELAIQGDIFYTLPIEESRKAIEDIASKKRSQYKKRYAMLDEYKDIIKQNLLDLTLLCSSK